MKRYLILENGTVFEGTAFGADSADVTGELVFSTVMSGFNELLASEKTYGQIVIQTFPSVGNCGVTEEEMSKKCYPQGYVVHEWCDAPSATNAPYTFDELLKKNGIPGIFGIDTRALTRILRDGGTQNAVICDEIPENVDISGYKIIGAVSEVTKGKTTEMFTPRGEVTKRVVLLNLGASGHIIDALTEKGAVVASVSPMATAEEILRFAPEGIVIGDGPGDPSENTTVIDNVKELIEKLSSSDVPTLGIGLGHCIFAIANGAKTEKLRFGHRGGQPVYDKKTGRTFITDQYHGYAVVTDSVSVGEVRFINSNDKTTEGIDYGKLGISTEFLHKDAVDTFFKLMTKE